MKTSLLNRPLMYLLQGHDPVATNDHEAFAAMLDADARRVARTRVAPDCHVSTVFLGLDHNFTGKGPPLLFETMVFGGRLDGDYQRTSTWDEAVKAHEAAVARARADGAGAA